MKVSKVDKRPEVKTDPKVLLEIVETFETAGSATSYMTLALVESAGNGDKTKAIEALTEGRLDRSAKVGPDVLMFYIFHRSHIVGRLVRSEIVRIDS